MDPAKPSLELLRALTDEHVLRALMREGRLTRAELATATGISKPTAGESVRRLVAAGLVADTGQRTPGGRGRGRVGSYYSLAADIGLALAVSIAPEGVVAECVDAYGGVVSRSEQPVDRPARPNQVAAALRAAATQVVTGQAATGQAVATQAAAGQAVATQAAAGRTVAGKNAVTPAPVVPTTPEGPATSEAPAGPAATVPAITAVPATTAISAALAVSAPTPTPAIQETPAIPAATTISATSVDPAAPAVGTVVNGLGGPVRLAVVSAADPVDRVSGRMVHLPDSPFLLGDLDPVDVLAPLVAGPVTVDNDVNWAARAERAAAADEDAPLDDFAYLYLGEGLGCAVVSDGEVRRGHHGLSGEIAHLLTVGPEGRATSLIDIFGELGLRQPGATAIDTPRLLAAVTETPATLATIAQAVAGAIAAIVALTDPAQIVLGGPWGARPLVAGAITAAVAELPRPVPVRPAHLTAEPSLAGAREATLTRLQSAIVTQAQPTSAT
jgi:predicted NBD/HSP70 family sugar kinase/DNA-binding transcriptional ArsR family regulator